MLVIPRSSHTGRGRSIQVVDGKVPEMKVVGTDALETGDRLLRRTDGRELRDQVILAGALE